MLLKKSGRKLKEISIAPALLLSRLGTGTARLWRSYRFFLVFFLILYFFVFCFFFCIFGIYVLIIHVTRTSITYLHFLQPRDICGHSIL